MADPVQDTLTVNEGTGTPTRATKNPDTGVKLQNFGVADPSGSRVAGVSGPAHKATADTGDATVAAILGQILLTLERIELFIAVTIDK